MSGRRPTSIVLALLVGILGCSKTETTAQSREPQIQPAAAAEPPTASQEGPFLKPVPAGESYGPVGPAPHSSLEETAHRVAGEIQHHQAVIEKDPKAVESLIFLGNALFDLQRFNEARDHYERALAVDPKNFRVRTDLASAYKHLGQPDRAISELQTVLKQNPDHETALYNYGVILLNDKKDRAGAIRQWETLIKKHPASPKAEGLKQKIAELRAQPG
jgi:tetratricopeptide (TPR) repeat protein